MNSHQDSENPYRAPAATLGSVEEPTAPGDSPDLVLATPLRRLSAVILDQLVGMLLFLPAIIMFIGLLLKTDDPVHIVGNEEQLAELLMQFGALGFALAFAGMAITFTVNAYLLVQNGQTIGKKLLGIRIANEYGDNPGFWMIAILRILVPGLIGIIPIVGSLFSLADPLFIFSERHRCLHDRIANTLVVEA